MFVRVDGAEVQEDIKGFSYQRKGMVNKFDFVNIVDEITLELSDGGTSGEFRVMVKDVPNLIKALKAAYKHQTGENIE